MTTPYATNETKTETNAEEKQQKTLYNCLQCGSLNALSKTDVVRCRECDYRIMCKRRTTKFACKYLAR
jgi:DNA-directed RNA polymerase subunit RPC12/RpoP